MKNRISILFVAIMLSIPAAFSQVIGISISANIAPPELPVYAQPICPADGYIWTPGYWAYDNVDGYYWVPGVWVSPPQYGYLWTPCYWGYDNGVYGFHHGYWGSHVGFYGGVNYGYGYGGVGYGGGMWVGHSFRYNTAVTNINRNMERNVYADNSVVSHGGNRTSFNGPGGVSAQPSPQEQSAMQEHHINPTGQQASHQQAASKDQNQFAKVNHGNPGTAAMNKVGGQHFNSTGSRATPSAGNHAQPAQQQRSATARSNTAQRAQNAPAQQQRQQQTRQQPQARQQQQAHQQPQQQARQQQSRQQPQQARPQPQQQARQQPQQARPQPQQSHAQPAHEESHGEGRR